MTAVSAEEWGEVIKGLLPLLNMCMGDGNPIIFESPHFMSVQWLPAEGGVITMSYDDRTPSDVVVSNRQ